MASPNPYSSPGDTSGSDAPAKFDLSLYGPPTGVRYGVLALAAAMSILLYLDRFAISVATPVMLIELDLNKQQMGYAISAFFWAYALAQVPSGWLTDTFGGRLMLAIYVVCWSLAIGLMGLVMGLSTLILLRLLLGVAQAGAYPTAASFLKSWIPLNRRGVSNSTVSMGGRIGGLLSNLVTPPLMSLVGLLFGIVTGQWRLVFAFYSLLGLAWTVMFVLWFRNTPRDHPWCNKSERALIDHGRPPVAANAQKASFGDTVLGFLEMLISPNLWLLSIINFCVNIGWIFLVTWMPTYLKEEFDVPLWFAGMMTACAGLAGMAGNLSGGLTTDFLVKRYGLTVGRRVPGLIASCGAALLYASCLGMEQLGIRHVLLVSAAFAGAYFLVDLGIGSLWATYQDIGGKRVATVLGFTNMCGNIGAAIFASVIGYFAENDQWPRVFLISSLSFMLTAMCWLFVNPRVPISSREAKAV